MNVDQLVTLLESYVWTQPIISCLRGNSTAKRMESPVLPVVANLYMENFEEKALSTTTNTPDIWLRYVDDAFRVLQNYVSEFTEHINNIDSNIKFTMEEPENNTVGFLDTKVTVRMMDQQKSRCIENLHTPINIKTGTETIHWNAKGP